MVLILFGFLSLTSAPAPAARALAVTELVMPRTADAVIAVTVDGAPLPASTALDILIDGEARTTVLVFGKVGRQTFRGLLYGVPAGHHEVTARPSPYWTWPAGAAPPSLTAFPAPDSAVLADAPALWLRSDTIGSSTDLPLMVYAEDLRENGSGVLRYSVIFSNEDGGTATPALLARWGRTTDIELVYEEDWRGGRVVASRYQAPDHKILDYAGPREGGHPSLVIATLNNVFLDRGRTAVRVSLVPALVVLTSATRESVMDREPWIYRRMADELHDEGKDTVVGDVRDYLFVDAQLTLEDAVVAAVARGEDGTWRSSDRGSRELNVDRNGWVRIAIPRSRGATDVGFVCSPGKTSGGRCRIEIGRVFSLTETYAPGPERGTGTLALQTGEMRAIPLRAAK